MKNQLNALWWLCLCVAVCLLAVHVPLQCLRHDQPSADYYGLAACFGERFAAAQ